MLYLLPGMGADQRMYPEPWASLPECSFINWPKYAGEKTLADVAAALLRTHTISAEAWLVGSSLGGMVACEMARLTPVRGIILVGSARSAEEVGAFLTVLGPLIDLAPLAFIQQLAGKMPGELTQMFKDSDPAFVRAMCRAIGRWPGCDIGATPLHRIHGRADRVIPLPQEVRRVLPGGHLIAMTHAEECVAHVREILAGG